MLTQLQITAAKPKTKPYRPADGQGLVLVVQTTGSKLWRFRYRYGGLQKTLHLGPWPGTSLADARDKCREAREAIADGLDPVLEKKRAKIVAQFSVATSFKEVASEWLAKRECEGLAQITLDKIRWLLGMIYPLIGSHPINAITPVEVLGVLRRIEARGNFESARRMRSVLSRVFRYGIATARCDRDVAADLRGALTIPKTKHHAAIVEPIEIGILLKTMDGYTGQAVTRMAMRLSPHLFVRPGELRQAEWSEIDLEKEWWSIPSERMKMRRPHRVPLSRQVLAMIGELREITGHRQFLFPCLGNPKRPMSENGVNQALRRLGYETHEMTAHGFRAMAATLLNEMGKWNPDAIERQLAHQEASSVRRAYGQEVRTALAARRQWLIEQQLADGERSAFRFRDGALDTLRQRELQHAGERIGGDIAKRFEPARIGERIEGKIARRVDLESGSFAVVERSQDFTLVPWRDVLERNIGKAASGIMRTDGISWQFGRGRAGPTIT